MRYTSLSEAAPGVVLSPPEAVDVPPLTRLHEAMSALADEPVRVALHCALDASARALREADTWEAEAQAAALSLAQQTLLTTLRDEIALAAELLPAPEPEIRDEAPRYRFWKRRAEPTQPRSWWDVVSDAVDALDGAADRLDDLAAGQPEDAPARAVVEAVGALLRAHVGQLCVQTARSAA